MCLVTRLLYFYIHFLVYGFIVILKLQVFVNYPTLSRITPCPTLPHPPIYIYIYIYISQKFPGVPLQSPGTALEAYFNYRHPFGYGNMHQEGFRCVNFKSTLGAPQKSSEVPQEHASSFPGAPVPPNPALHTHTQRHRHTHTHRERKVG